MDKIEGHINELGACRQRVMRYWKKAQERTSIRTEWLQKAVDVINEATESVSPDDATVYESLAIELEEMIEADEPLTQTVALVCDLGGELSQYFHLTPCACGQPVWQQPCPLCGYYPMGNDPQERERCASMGLTREHWLAAVARHGNIGAWYFASYKTTVAWKDLEFRTKILEIIERSRKMVWPDPEAVYEAATRKGA
jgi:hypothetical protein